MHGPNAPPARVWTRGGTQPAPGSDIHEDAVAMVGVQPPRVRADVGLRPPAPAPPWASIERSAGNAPVRPRGPTQDGRARMRGPARPGGHPLSMAQMGRCPAGPARRVPEPQRASALAGSETSGMSSSPITDSISSSFARSSGENRWRMRSITSCTYEELML